MFTNFPQGSKSIQRWSQEVLGDAAKMINYDNYDWQHAAMDAIILQTSNTKLRERALQENVTYDKLLQLGIAREQSEKGAVLLEQASGHRSNDTRVKLEEDVQRLKLEKKWKQNREPHDKEKKCGRCGRGDCKVGR